MKNNKNQENTNFRNINGKQIRRQYFDLPLVIILSISFIVICSEILKAVFKEDVLLNDVMTELKTDIWAVCVLIISLFFLKLLNSFSFGEILCTLTSRGVHCKSGFFAFDEIVGATYHVGGPNIAFRSGVTLVVNRKGGAKNDVLIYHAPFGLLRQIKRHKNNIVTDFTLFTKETMVLFGLFTLLAPIFVAFFG